MKNAAALTLTALALALSACDRPKQSEQAAAPPAGAGPVAAPASGAPMSTGLVKGESFPGFYLDSVNEAVDPMNKPASIVGGKPLTMSGFGFDSVTNQPARGVDIVLDGTAYGTTYGHLRQDVADYKKSAALGNTGYTVTIPASAATAGEHTVVVRVISSDGKSYAESPAIKFTVQ
ncbi:hypothetical protein [Phenylobacterium sp.]|uniref:hypothetical protein n=1 Tax=Phenylobacterium sp. TaxID=1871053 RepID=UPI0039839278